MAARTSRVRLGTMLTPLPWRRPWKVASQVATLDQLSGGRAILAVGGGALAPHLPPTGGGTHIPGPARRARVGVRPMRAPGGRSPGRPPPYHAYATARDGLYPARRGGAEGGTRGATPRGPAPRPRGGSPPPRPARGGGLPAAELPLHGPEGGERRHARQPGQRDQEAAGGLAGGPAQASGREPAGQPDHDGERPGPGQGQQGDADGGHPWPSRGRARRRPGIPGWPPGRRSSPRPAE